MEWWTTSIGGQRNVGVSADQSTCGSHLDSTISVGTAFDPWLSADELDLSAILNQANCTNATPPAEVGTQITTIARIEASSEAKLDESHGHAQLVANTDFQSNHHANQTQVPISACRGIDHSQSAADNKRHIIEIINNSSSGVNGHRRPHQYQPNRGHHNQLPANGFSCGVEGGSLAGSPMSSSLGSSPISSQAQYPSSPHSSLSPASSSSTMTATSASATTIVTTTTSQNFKQQSYDEIPSSTRGSHDSSGSSLDGTTKHLQIVQHQQQQQQHQESSYFPECYIIEEIANGASKSQDRPQESNGETYMLHASDTNKSQLVYQDNTIVMDSPQQQQPQYHHQRMTGRGATLAVSGRTSGGSSGSSLLSALQIRTANQKQPVKQTQMKGCTARPLNQMERASSSEDQQQQQQMRPPKTRRCRNITEFVLADEERRLLIKEGHEDFPVDCRSRPLTKCEERILRKIRRKIRNKKSAQCSRQRKKEYVEELERKYTVVLKENEELKQLLASHLNDEKKFISMLAADTHQQQQQEQSDQLRDYPHLRQQLTPQQEQQALFDTDGDNNHHSEGKNFRINGTNLSSMEQMSWKDIFPQAQEQQQYHHNQRTIHQQRL